MSFGSNASCCSGSADGDGLVAGLQAAVMLATQMAVIRRVLERMVPI